MRAALLLIFSVLLALFASCGPKDEVLNRNVPPGGDNLCPPDDAGTDATEEASVDPPDADLGDGDVEGSAPVEASAPPPSNNTPKVPCAGSKTKKDSGADTGPDAPLSCSPSRSCNDKVVCIEFDKNTTALTRDDFCDVPIVADACDTTNAIGRCVVADGNSCRTFYYFPPLFTVANAKQSCDFEGGTFVPSD